MSPERQKIELDNLEDSIKRRQPIQAGSALGEPMRVNFLRWAKGTPLKPNMPPEEVARIERIDKTYRDTAHALGLMTLKAPTERSLKEAMRKIQVMAE